MRQFETAGAPHLPPRRSVRQLMAWVLLALLPAFVAQLVCYGIGPLLQLALAVMFALLFEAVMLSLRKQPLRPFLTDLSAPLAAALFALCLPPLAPWWIAALGMFAAIVVAKHAYGGLGHNLFNPAMVGFAVVLICFPLEMSRWPPPLAADSISLSDSLRAVLAGIAPAPDLDAMAQATPLDSYRQAAKSAATLTEAANSQAAGIFGPRGLEWIVFGYALGGIALLALRLIPWQVPAALFGTVILISAPLHLFDPDLYLSPTQQLWSGGLVMAAFFIATDPVSGCTTPRGRLIFAAGVALLTLAIRRWGNYPDGVAFAILLMNCVAPWIDLHTRPRIFGERDVGRRDGDKRDGDKRAASE